MTTADLWVVLAVAAGVTLALAVVVFWIWMLIDCLTRESKEGQDRLVWALVIVFTKLVGAALYYFLRYRRRGRLPGAAAA